MPIGALAWTLVSTGALTLPLESPVPSAGAVSSSSGMASTRLADSWTDLLSRCTSCARLGGLLGDGILRLFQLSELPLVPRGSASRVEVDAAAGLTGAGTHVRRARAWQLEHRGLPVGWTAWGMYRRWMTVGKNGRAAGRDAFDRLTVPINRDRAAASGTGRARTCRPPRRIRRRRGRESG